MTSDDTAKCFYCHDLVHATLPARGKPACRECWDELENGKVRPQGPTTRADTRPWVAARESDKNYEGWDNVDQ